MDATECAVNKLESTFEDARAYYGAKANRELYLQKLDELRQFMEGQGYDDDREMDEDDYALLRESFLEKQQGSHQAVTVLNRILKLLAQERANSPQSLLSKPMFRKYHHFKETVDTVLPHGDLSNAVEAALSKPFQALWSLEKVAAKNRMAFTEMMVTQYHESGLPLHEFVAQSPLLRQCRESGNVALFEKLQRYLVQYEHSVARPLWSRVSGQRYGDNINIVVSYMTEINSALHRMVTRRAFPLQLDVYFVAPGCHQNLNLHSLRGLDAEHRSDPESRRNGAIDGTSDVYRLLRDAANDMNSEHRQRFILLVVRGKRDDAVDDTLYLYRPAVANEIAPDYVSDHVELSYLVNSKSEIVDGLKSDAEGVLGFCHHLHAQECGKVYLSYGAYKSRVFKNRFLERLTAIFNCSHSIDKDCTKPEFMLSYTDFEDSRYSDLGKYWFAIIDGAYECWEPSWNPENCRAMGNVFISKPCTQDLIDHIDEHYGSTERLYYRMDYTVGMQIVDGEAVHFKRSGTEDDSKDITLIHMDLHRGGEALYAVIVPNQHKSKQKWKVREYEQIGEAFMTKKELIQNFGIFERDLPRGSRAKHSNFEEQLSQITVTPKLIRNTNWSHIRIVQSKQNCAKSGMVSGRNKRRKGTGKAGARSVCGNKICGRRFQQLALDSLNKLQSEGAELTPIAHFKFRKNQYHLEKLLPVHIPDQGLVAVSFFFNQSVGKTQASGVCLDLTDIRNKANLVRSVMDEETSWLNPLNDDQMTMNNLVIEECEKQCDHRGHLQSENQKASGHRSKNQRRREKQYKRGKGKAPRHHNKHNGRNGGNKKIKNNNKTPSLPSLSPPPSSNASIKEGYSTESGSVHSRQSSPEMGYPVNRDKDTKRTLTPPEYRSTLGLQNPAMSPLAAPCVQTPVAAPVIGVGQFWFVGQAVAPVMAAPNQFGVVNIQPQVVYNGHFQVTPCPQPNFGAIPNGYCPQPALGGFVPNGRY